MDDRSEVIVGYLVIAIGLGLAFALTVYFQGGNQWH